MPFWSEDQHKRQSTHLKRLSGGIGSQLAKAEDLGLSERECAALKTAAVTLDALALRHSEAQRILKRKESLRVRREQVARGAMKTTFLALASNSDRIAFLAAKNSYHLRQGGVRTVADLEYYFKDEVNSLIYGFSKREELTPEQLVAEAWQKFEEAKPGLVAQHQGLIDRLRE